MEKGSRQGQDVPARSIKTHGQDARRRTVREMKLHPALREANQKMISALKVTVTKRFLIPLLETAPHF